MPAAYPADYALPALRQGIVVTGLGLKATVAPPPAVDGLPWVMGGASWEVSGPIGLLGGLPLLCLAADPGAGLEVAGYQFSFGLTLATAPVAVPTPPAPGVQSVLQLDAAIEKDVGGQSPLKLPFRARLTEATSTWSRSPRTSPRAPQWSSRRSVEALLAGGSTTGQLPSTGIPALDDISLEGVELVVAPASKSLINAAVTVGYVSPPPWSPLGGLISIDQVAVAFFYVPGATPSMTTQMSAASSWTGASSTRRSICPRCRSRNLEAGQTIDIAELVKSASGGSVTMGDRIACTALKLTGDLTTGAYGFAATVTDDWSFDLGTVPLALTEVGFAIDYDPSAGTSGEVVGTFSIAGCSLYVRASYDKATAWTFAGGTLDPVTIAVGDLLADVEKLFGVTAPSGTTPAGITPRT